jgi:hypothetical protein
MSAVGAGEALRFAGIPVPGGVSGLPPVIIGIQPESFWAQYGRPVAMYSDYTIRDQNGVVLRDLKKEADAYNAANPSATPRRNYLSIGSGLTSNDVARLANGDAIPGAAGGILATLTGQDLTVMKATLAAGVEQGFAAPTATPWQIMQEGPYIGLTVYTDGSIRSAAGAVVKPAGTLMPRDASVTRVYDTVQPSNTPIGVATVAGRAPETTTDPSNAGARVDAPNIFQPLLTVLKTATEAAPTNPNPGVAGAGVTLNTPAPSLTLGTGLALPSSVAAAATMMEGDGPLGMSWLLWGILALLLAWWLL